MIDLAARPIAGRFAPPIARAATWWAVAVVAVVAAYALLAPVLAPDQLAQADFTRARSAPSWAHPFGTDYAGHDLFVRVAQGLRVSLLIAAVCALVSAVIGVAVGTVAAVAGPRVDAVLMRVTDAVNGLPHLLLGIVIVALFRGSVVAIIVSIAATHWPQVARVVRSEALTTRRMEYVDAAFLGGATRRRVLLRHIVPATLGQAMIAVVLLLPHAIWHESTLSFLGLGLSPDRPSLGTLLEQSRGEVLLGGWWSLVVPAVALVVATLGVAGVGAALRRALAPQADPAVVR